MHCFGKFQSGYKKTCNADLLEILNYTFTFDLRIQAQLMKWIFKNEFSESFELAAVIKASRIVVYI